MVGGRGGYGDTAVHGSLIPDFLIPDSQLLIPDSHFLGGFLTFNSPTGRIGLAHSIANRSGVCAHIW